jgi:hypothetical protein
VLVPPDSRGRPDRCSENKWDTGTSSATRTFNSSNEMSLFLIDLVKVRYAQRVWKFSVQSQFRKDGLEACFFPGILEHFASIVFLGEKGQFPPAGPAKSFLKFL